MTSSSMPIEGQEFIEQYYLKNADLGGAKLVAYQWALREQLSAANTPSTIVLCDLDMLDKRIVGTLQEQYPELIALRKFKADSGSVTLLQANVALAKNNDAYIIISIDNGPNRFRSFFMRLKYSKSEWHIQHVEEMEVT